MGRLEEAAEQVMAPRENGEPRLTGRMLHGVSPSRSARLVVLPQLFCTSSRRM